MTVFDASSGTPFALVRLDAVQSNIATMRAFCAGSGVRLAPHVKTTMSPELVRLQMAAGAWGATVATPAQATAVEGFGPDVGVERILIANEVVDPHALMSWRDRSADQPQLSWYVDSAEGLDLARRIAGSRENPPRLLVELGHEGGRTGVRDDAVALELARRVAATPEVCLAGIAGYEGTLGFARDSTVAVVDDFLHRIHVVFRAIREESLFTAPGPAVVSAGGSAYFDRVGAILGPLADAGTDVVLRSGCYLTHDHGLYARSSPTTRPDWPLEPFRAALEVWGRVLSTPEPGLALVDVGRRDVSYDAGLPTPLRARRIDGRAPRDITTARVTRLNDQHAYVECSEEEFDVGDLIGFGVSHPCTTFDRWRTLHLVDADFETIAQITTVFP